MKVIRNYRNGQCKLAVLDAGFGTFVVVEHWKSGMGISTLPFRTLHGALEHFQCRQRTSCAYQENTQKSRHLRQITLEGKPDGTNLR